MNLVIELFDTQYLEINCITRASSNYEISDFLGNDRPSMLVFTYTHALSSPSTAELLVSVSSSLSLELFFLAVIVTLNIEVTNLVNIFTILEATFHL